MATHHELVVPMRFIDLQPELGRKLYARLQRLEDGVFDQVLEFVKSHVSTLSRTAVYVNYS